MKELSSYPRTAFLSTDSLPTRTVFLPMHCLSTRIVFLPTDSLPTYGLTSYLRIVFPHRLSSYIDCLPTQTVFLLTDCLPTNGLSSYQRTVGFTPPSWLAQDSAVTSCVTRWGPSHQRGHQLRHTPGAQSPARSPVASHAGGTVTSAATRSVTRRGHSHQRGAWRRCLATSPSRNRTACFFSYRTVERKKNSNCDMILYRQSHQFLFE